MRKPFCLKQIHDAERQRIVRPDDGKADLLVFGKGEQSRQIFRLNVDALDGRTVAGRTLPGDARVARRAPQFRDARRLREFPNQRVFAPAGANDQNFHRSGLKQEAAALASFLGEAASLNNAELSEIIMEINELHKRFSTLAAGIFGRVYAW